MPFYDVTMIEMYAITLNYKKVEKHNIFLLNIIKFLKCL